jgi:hypothetical protein
MSKRIEWIRDLDGLAGCVQTMAAYRTVRARIRYGYHHGHGVGYVVIIGAGDHDLISVDSEADGMRIAEAILALED